MDFRVLWITIRVFFSHYSEVRNRQLKAPQLAC